MSPREKEKHRLNIKPRAEHHGAGACRTEEHCGLEE